LANVVHYGRLWESSSLLLLVVTGFHPSDSAFNYVERSLSHLTFDITGMIISDEIDGTKVNANSDATLIKRLFENSIGELNAKWDNKVVDDFLIKSEGVTELEADAIDNELWRTYLMKDKVKRDTEKNEQVKFYLDHAVKTSDLLYFGHCSLFNRDPCEYCSKLLLSNFLCDVKEKYGLLPVPIPSNVNPGMRIIIYLFIISILIRFFLLIFL
jgi:hypothetical protein